MLSLVNSVRTAARRQSCRLQAARAVSSSSAAKAPILPTLEVNNMDQMSEYIHDAAEEQQTIAAGSVGQVPYIEGIVDPRGKPSSTSSGDIPALKSLERNKFVQPYSFTRDAVEKTSQGSFTKRPLLGPDASTSRYLDVFHQMDIDPLQECQNSKIMSRFVTSMGKIKGRNETNLTWKNQRRIGKAIRRAKMMGIIPLLSRRTLLYEPNKR